MFNASEGVRALRTGSRTTQPMRAGGQGVRGEGQLLGNSRTLREHKPQPFPVPVVAPVVPFKSGNETQVAHFYTHLHKTTGREHLSED
jgi:hypothetical protein